MAHGAEKPGVGRSVVLEVENTPGVWKLGAEMAVAEEVEEWQTPDDDDVTKLGTSLP